MTHACGAASPPRSRKPKKNKRKWRESREAAAERGMRRRPSPPRRIPAAHLPPPRHQPRGRSATDVLPGVRVLVRASDSPAAPPGCNPGLVVPDRESPACEETAVTHHPSSPMGEETKALRLDRERRLTPSRSSTCVRPVVSTPGRRARPTPPWTSPSSAASTSRCVRAVTARSSLKVPTEKTAVGSLPSRR